MKSAETCPRCHRSFGGDQAYRRAHPRHGQGKREERCRSVKELRQIGLRRDADGVWHREGRQRVGQLRFPLWGRGRPRKALPIYSLHTLGGDGVVVRVLRHGRGRRHAEVSVEPAEETEAVAA